VRRLAEQREAGAGEEVDQGAVVVGGARERHGVVLDYIERSRRRAERGGEHGRFVKSLPG
jgi:hypothetical protein